MPHRKNDQFFVSQLVIHKVSDAPEVKAAHGWQFGVCDFDADPGLPKEQSERAVKIGSKRARGSRSVREPPPFGAFNLPGCSARDTQREWHCLPQAVQAGEEFLG